MVGDLRSAAETRSIADQINGIGRMDAIIHNAGVYSQRSRDTTPEGHASTLAINTLAPYMLTALIQRPGRLVYLSSGLHAAEKDRWVTLTGQSGHGIRHGPTPRASCTSLPWLSRWRGAGRRS